MGEERTTISDDKCIRPSGWSVKTRRIKTDVNIGEITRRIVRIAKPRKIVLFGSRGRGQGRRDSDWDILVIADSRKPRHERAAPLYGALSDLRKPVDILVYTPEEATEWRNVSQALVTTALSRGTVLYEKT